MHHTPIQNIEKGNWVLNGDCVNLIGNLTAEDITEISNLEKIRVIQPWKFMPSEASWLALNEKVFSKHPETELHIWADTIKSDFIFLGKMSNVKILDLNQVKFKEKETLKELTQLERLTLTNGNVNELHFLANLTKLEHLEIGYIRGLVDISFISQLINLKHLEITSQARITELPKFESLPALKTLGLINLKNLKDVSSIENIPNLEGLYFHGLNVEVAPSQFDFLKNMKKLKEVRAHFNTKEKRNRFEVFKNEILPKEI